MGVLWVSIVRDVYLVHHQPEGFTRRSAFPPLIETLGARTLLYEPVWSRLQGRSWTLGQLLRQFGNWYYGSTWNALVPLRDELRFLRAIKQDGRCVVHFLWGEFASPKLSRLYRRKGALLVGTFHCGARRQASVLGRFRCLEAYDRLVVVSRTQIPFFVDRGYPEDRIHVIPLGVDTGYFHPLLPSRKSREGPLRAILVGQTERDHVFAAEVMRRMPSDAVRLYVCTHPDSHPLYAGLANVELLPRLTDEELLRLYQTADLMLMPMLDCSAPDAMLESMACGTPVMTNRVGGIPEYLNSECCLVMEGKNVDEWLSALAGLSNDRSALAGKVAAVRAWAERFSWRSLAERHVSLYQELLGEGA